MFIEQFEISHSAPAPYNPRSIDAAGARRLRHSLKTIGIVRALIVGDNNVVIAGHQRRDALIAIGKRHSPAHVLAGVSGEDEIRFNQLHNGADVEIGDGELRMPRCRAGWSVIDPRQVKVIARPTQAAKLNEVCRLLSKHGPWGNAVATTDGNIIACKLYAFACVLLGIDLHVCTIAATQADTAAKLLGSNYGRFSYDRLPRTTWVQSLAQMYRIRNGREAKGKSRTYEQIVMPRIDRSMRILDFGAGQMDYVRYLQRRKYNIMGVEFYRRRTGTMSIDLPAVHRDIDRMCDSLRLNGLFDVVVCDSVLNSIDTRQAEADVLATINAMCRPGGMLIFSGRRRSFEERIEHRSKIARSVCKRHVYFLDESGFSAMYQRGVWLFQRFHRDAEVEQLAKKFIGEPSFVRRATSGWAAWGLKSIEAADAERSVAREFDLPLPDGSSVGRSPEVADALAAARRLSALKTSAHLPAGKRAARSLQTAFLPAPATAKAARQSKDPPARRTRSKLPAAQAAFA